MDNTNIHAAPRGEFPRLVTSSVRGLPYFLRMRENSRGATGRPVGTAEPDSSRGSRARRSHGVRARRIVATTWALALVGCGGGDEGPSARIAGDTPTAGERSPADSAAKPTGSIRIALDGAGLRLVDPGSGSARPLEFGSAESTAVVAVTAALGAPLERGANSECGAGPLEFAVFRSGLTLTLQERRFAGWSVRGTDGREFTTMAGIGLGSTRAELESVHAATIQSTSLGTEFHAGGLQGVLESGAPGARITHLWAGVNCIAR